jgi:Tfp pilus assembly protein PilF
MLTVILFFCNARYRMPVIPALLLLATHAGFTLVRSVRERRWRPVTIIAAVGVPAAILVNYAPDYRNLRIANLHLNYAELASFYHRRGDLRRAEENYRLCVQTAPDFLKGHIMLAGVLEQQGRDREAIEEYKAALRSTPRLEYAETEQTIARVHSALATALLGAQHFEEAEVHFRKAVELAPGGRRGYDEYNLGVLLIRKNELDTAVRWIQAALNARPEPGLQAEAERALNALRGMLEEQMPTAGPTTPAGD